MPTTTTKQRLMARLDRAGANLDEIDELFQQFFTTERPFEVTSQQDLYTDEIVCYVRLLREPPLLHWASILGDIVHGLRATLDNLVWELSTAFSGQPPDDPIPTDNPWRRVSFPIARNDSQWKPTARHGPLWAVDPSLIPVFRKYQPFVTNPKAADREPLAILQELWNIDKHRHIHVIVLGVAPNPGSIFALPEQGRGLVTKVRGMRKVEVGKRTELFSVQVAKKVIQYVDMNWNIVFALTFDLGPPTFGRDTTEFLRSVKDTIVRIVAEFEPYLT